MEVLWNIAVYSVLVAWGILAIGLPTVAIFTPQQHDAAVEKLLEKETGYPSRH